MTRYHLAPVVMVGEYYLIPMSCFDCIYVSDLVIYAMGLVQGLS